MANIQYKDRYDYSNKGWQEISVEELMLHGMTPVLDDGGQIESLHGRIGQQAEFVGKLVNMLFERKLLTIGDLDELAGFGVEVKPL